MSIIILAKKKLRARARENTSWEIRTNDVIDVLQGDCAREAWRRRSRKGNIKLMVGRFMFRPLLLPRWVLSLSHLNSVLSIRVAWRPLFAAHRNSFRTQGDHKGDASMEAIEVPAHYSEYSQ